MKTIYSGCCGFPVSRKNYFEELDIVELQNTFYTIPSIETAKKLREEAKKVNPEFKFTMKAYQVITHRICSPTYRRTRVRYGDTAHYGSFQPTKEVLTAWERTKEVARALKCSFILFQTPSSFAAEEGNVKNIREFFSSIERQDFRFALELRGWDLVKVKEVCKEVEAVPVVDPFKESIDTLAGVRRDISYFRLHGLPGYNLGHVYSREELRHLWDFCRSRENYVFFNNIRMFDNCVVFKQMVKESAVQNKRQERVVDE